MKDKIKGHFNKAYRTYDEYCSVQNDACDRSLTLLTQYASSFETIADFACGTGESTLKLINHIQHKKCYAIDFSDKLLNLAVNKLPPTVHCLLSDFDEHLFDDAFLDLIFCNMGLQWSLDLEKTLSLLNAYLSRNGYFVFSMPMGNNFPEIKAEFKYTSFSAARIIQALNDSGFNLLEHSVYNQVQSFQSHHEALKSVQKVGANFSPLSHAARKGLKKINVREVFVDSDVSPQLTYCISVYVCKK